MRVGGRSYRAVAWNAADGVVAWVEQRLLPYRFSVVASADPEDDTLPAKTGEHDLRSVMRLEREVGRPIADAPHASYSGETSYLVPHNARPLIALAALPAQGLRPAQGPGHRAVVFQVLPHTAGAAAELWGPLRKAHDKRNQIE